jgi:sulfite oxidase
VQRIVHFLLLCASDDDDAVTLQTLFYHMALRFGVFAAMGAAVGVGIGSCPRDRAVLAAPASPSKNRATTGKCRSDLPEYSTDDIRAHLSAKKGGRVWVTYKCGVYDVTEFVEQHPGGIKRIMLAAGGDIERFWKQFTIHDDDAVRDILERHRIGSIKGYKPVVETSGSGDAEAILWANEPERSPALIPLSKRPFNAETPEGVLDEFFTPNDMFFVRNHMPVPVMQDAHKSFCLQVEGEGLIPRCFPIAELKSMFPHRTVVNTIQCGGNRRSEMSAAFASESGAAVKGLSWSNGGIGTATWTGVSLRDVINVCRAPVVASAASVAAQQHVLFEGADKDPAGHFNVSVPWDLVMDPHSDALIAFEMNGESIPRDHGFPLRAIVPGTVGVRNCKWLQRVQVQSCESQSVWQQQDYKNFPSYATKPEAGLPSVYAMPVQSSITDVSFDGAADCVVAKGYAYAGGGSGVQRVDVSFDGGKSFETSAQCLPVPPGALEKSTPKTRRDTWAWRQLACRYPQEHIKAKPQPCTEDHNASCYNVCFKATTDDQATQPPIAPYNFRGLLYNGYSCREVRTE